MDVGYISNNHLKEILNAILNSGDLDEELLLNLTRELRFSTFISPGIYNEMNDSFDYPLLDLDNGSSVLPVFTDEKEYMASELINDEFEPVLFYFDQSFDLLEDDNIEGLIVNPNKENFFITKEIISVVSMSQFGFTNSLDNDDSFASDGEELKLIFDTVSNDSLIEFMNDESNAFDWDGLFNEFSKSMLNTIIVNEDLEKNSSNIYKIEPENVVLVTEFDEENKPWAVLLANKDSFYKKLSFQEDKSIFYAQLINPEVLVTFVLENDYEGIMLYNEDLYIPIPRSVLLEKYDSIKILGHNPRLNNSINYVLL